MCRLEECVSRKKEEGGGRERRNDRTNLVAIKKPVLVFAETITEMQSGLV